MAQKFEMRVLPRPPRPGKAHMHDRRNLAISSAIGQQRQQLTVGHAKAEVSGIDLRVKIAEPVDRGASAVSG